MDEISDVISLETIIRALRDLHAVKSVTTLEDGWFRINGQDRSILLCGEINEGQRYEQVERATEILSEDTTGVVFVDPPTLAAISIGNIHYADIYFPECEEDEIVDTVCEIVAEISEADFEDFSKPSFREFSRLLNSLLTPLDNRPTDHNGSHGQNPDGFEPALPIEMESEIADLVVSWILRVNPKRVADFGSGGDALTGTLSKRLADDVPLYCLDLPTRNARVGRLMTAYRYPSASTENVHKLSYPVHVDNDQVQEEPDDFEDETLNESDSIGSVETFDAIVSGLIPDTINNAGDQIRNRMRQLGISRPYTGLSTYTAVESMHRLSEGGRGAFVLTLNQLTRFNVLSRAFEQGRVESLLLLGRPDEPTDDRSSHPKVIVLFEKSSTTAQTEEVRVVEITSGEFDPRVNRLVQAPIEQVNPDDTANIDGVEYREIPSDDLVELEPRLILYEPQLAPFLRADETKPLEDVVGEVRRNRPTGANDFFYFENEESENSGIPRRFLTPILKHPPEDSSLCLTTEDTSHYALDLREYLETLETRGTEITEESVLQALQQDGYTTLVDYIEDNRKVSENRPFGRNDVWFCPFQTRDRSVESLLFRRFSDGSWHRLQNRDVLVDQHWSIFECESEVADQLHILLNSEPYQELLKYYGHNHGTPYQSIPFSDLRGLPIATGPLEEGLDDFGFPASRRREQRKIDEAVIERCRDSSTSEALESLLDPDDRFAWAWFLSPAEYEQFKDMYDSDEERAEGFIADRLHEDQLKEMVERIGESDLHTERWDIIEDLADEYREENYRLFIYGATPQFEGFIMDWARKNEYSVVWEKGRPYVEVEKESGGDKLLIPKGLGALIDTFLPRGFGDFLQDEVKKLRDKTAHGEVIENSREQAAVCLLSLHTLALEISEGRLQD